MWTMYPDIEFSRRSTMVCIFNDENELQWSGKGLIEALEFLQQEGIERFQVEGDEIKFKVHIEPIGT